MKVAIVTQFPAEPTTPNGGVESVSVNLVQALSHLEDIDIHVITTDPSSHHNTVTNWNGVRVHRLPQSGRVLTFAIGRGRKQLREYLRVLSPDVVHAHDTYGIMTKGLPYPRVFTIHGFIYADTRISGQRWARSRSRIWERVETDTWAEQPHIISISPYVRSHLKGLAKGSIYDIDNPVSERFFCIERNELKGRLFSAASISPLKNTLGLLQGFARLLSLGVEAELRLAGAVHDDGYLKRVRRFIVQHGLTNCVKLLGRIDRDAISRELGNASVFVLVSLQENAPMCVEEAMAAGVPVVTSNRCGMPYMIRDGNSGFLVDPEDPEDIARRLQQLLNDDELRAAMGGRSREIAKDRFHPNQVARRTLEVYRRAVRDHQRGNAHG